MGEAELFSKDQELDRAIVHDERLSIYKLLIDMADRVSQRRQSSNSFYLTLNSLIVGAIAGFAGTVFKGDYSLITIALLGIMISVIWLQSIRTYKNLNSAKFKVINAFEDKLSVRPFNYEWELLSRNTDDKFIEFHRVEKYVPIAFFLFYSSIIGIISYDMICR